MADQTANKSHRAPAKAFHVPADLKPLGRAATPIINAMRQQFQTLHRHSR